MPKKMTFKNSSETANDKGTFQEGSKMEKNKKLCVPLSGTLTRVDLNVPTQQYDYYKTLGEGWQLFLT